MQFIGRVLRKRNEENLKIAPTWTAEGKRYPENRRERKSNVLEWQSWRAAEKVEGTGQSGRICSRLILPEELRG